MDITSEKPPKAQSSLELLVTISFGLALLLPIIIAGRTNANTIK